MAHRFQKFFRPKDKSPHQQQKERGIPGEGEKEEWLQVSQFTELPPRGKEAFFRYLRGDKYPEQDKDIVDVKADAVGMDNNDARRYQFWIKCEKIELEDLFTVYVEDDDTKLPDVNELAPHDFLKEKINDAKKTQKFITDLKDKIMKKLNAEFDKFKEKQKEN